MSEPSRDYHAPRLIHASEVPRVMPVADLLEARGLFARQRQSTGDQEIDEELGDMGAEAAFDGLGLTACNLIGLSLAGLGFCALNCAVAYINPQRPSIPPIPF